MIQLPFADRAEAGRLLAAELATLKLPENVIVLIANGPFQTLDQDLIRALDISPEVIDAVINKEKIELGRRENLYRKGRPSLDLRGRTVLLVDDGLATGSTMRVATRYANSHKPARTLIAVPVASVQACQRLREEADACICLATPEPFVAVGQWYADFPQVNDSEVQRFLEAGRLPSKGNRSELLTR